MEDNTIFDLISNLIFNILKNKETIHDYKSERNTSIEISVKKEVSNKLDDVSKLKQFVEKVIKKNNIEMLYTLVAIDELKFGVNNVNDEFRWVMKNNASIEYLNSQENYKKTNVRVYLTYTNFVNKERECVDELGPLLKNIVYYTGKSTIKNIYIDDDITGFLSKNKFEIVLLPYSNIYKTGYKKEKLGNEKSVLTPFFDESQNNSSIIPYTKDDNASTRLFSDLDKVLDKVDFIIMPETFSNVFANQVYDKVKNHETFVFGPAFYKDNCDGTFESRANITSKYLKSRKAPVKKNYSYQDKFEIDGVSYAENIITHNPAEYTILHLEGFGRILTLICSDWFYVNQYEELIYSMNIDFVFIISATQSYNEFDKYFIHYRKENRYFIQCNLCSECIGDDNKTKDMAPVHVYGNYYDKEDNKIKDGILDTKKYNIVNYDYNNKSCIIKIKVSKEVNNDRGTYKVIL